MRGRWGFRGAALLAVGALSLHELRYWVVDGTAGDERPRPLHMPLAVGLGAVLLLLACASFGRTLVLARRGIEDTGHPPPFRVLWPLLSGALLSVFFLRSRSRAGSPRPPHGLGHVAGHIGWAGVGFALAIGARDRTSAARRGPHGPRARPPPRAPGSVARARAGPRFPNASSHQGSTCSPATSPAALHRLLSCAGSNAAPAGAAGNCTSTGGFAMGRTGRISTLACCLGTHAVDYRRRDGGGRIRPDQQGRAVTLHVTPDDEPVAGQASRIIVSKVRPSRGRFSWKSCKCYLRISDSTGNVVLNRKAKRTTTFTFPKATAYEIVFTGRVKRGSSFKRFRVNFAIRAS